MVCASIENSEQPAHPRSLTRVVDRRYMGSKGFNFSPGGNLRFWLDCAGALIDLNHHCTQYQHVPYTENRLIYFKSGAQGALLLFYFVDNLF